MIPSTPDPSQTIADPATSDGAASGGATSAGATPAVRAVLFDFAGVVTAPMGPALARLARECGAEPAELTEFLFAGYGSVTGDSAWHRVERGEMALAEFYAWGRAAGAERGWTVELSRFVDALLDGPLRDEIVTLAPRLRAAGYRTALVTNNAREAAPRWRARIPVAEMFDAVIDSSQVGLRKPDPAIFELALSRLGVSAAEAVFLDDMAVNVAGARAAGLHAIQVGPDSAPALAALATLLGRPLP